MPSELRSTPAARVRRIAAAKNTDAEPASAEERFRRVVLSVPREQAHVLETTLELAGLVSPRGMASSKWERLEHMFQEFIGAHGAPEVAPPDESWEDPPRDVGAHAGASESESESEAEPIPIDLDAIRRLGGRDGALLAKLYEELQQQQHLTRLLPPPDGSKIPVVTLERELRELASMRTRWEELFGRLCTLVRDRGAAGHHLEVVHRGFLTVSGQAPQAVVWRIGPELSRMREEEARRRAA